MNKDFLFMISFYLNVFEMLDLLIIEEELTLNDFKKYSFFSPRISFVSNETDTSLKCRNLSSNMFTHTFVFKRAGYKD